ncbi:hypothetical protein PSYRMG_25980 (plasmid) [Pseudomonas syringae UMAF0158]|nr:hypothetical protein PSYRMG_25980 [Pseudomonas syringae UMAF0158]
MHTLRILGFIIITFHTLLDISTLAANLTTIFPDPPSATLTLPLPQCPR